LKLDSKNIEMFVAVTLPFKLSVFGQFWKFEKLLEKTRWTIFAKEVAVGE